MYKKETGVNSFELFRIWYGVYILSYISLFLCLWFFYISVNSNSITHVTTNSTVIMAIIFKTLVLLNFVTFYDCNSTNEFSHEKRFLLIIIQRLKWTKKRNSGGVNSWWFGITFSKIFGFILITLFTRTSLSREYIKLTVFWGCLSTSHDVEFDCCHDGRLECWCQGNQTSPIR